MSRSFGSLNGQTPTPMIFSHKCHHHQFERQKRTINHLLATATTMSRRIRIRRRRTTSRTNAHNNSNTITIQLFHIFKATEWAFKGVFWSFWPRSVEGLVPDISGYIVCYQTCNIPIDIFPSIFYNMIQKQYFWNNSKLMDFVLTCSATNFCSNASI